MAGRRVSVQPAPGCTAIEVVLRDVFLRTLGPGSDPWAGPLSSVLSRMGSEALMIVDGPTLSDHDMVDRYVYTGDLSHRVLFERRLAGRPGKPALWVLDETGVTDMCQAKDGQLKDRPTRSALAQLLAPTRSWIDSGDHGPVDGVAIVNLTTARSGPAESRGAYKPPAQDTIRAADAFTTRAVRGAAVVVGAWGVVENDYDAQRVSRVIEDAGGTVHGLVTHREGRDVRWLTTDTPKQPRMPRGLSAIARPVPLDELRADTSLPLP